MEFVAHEMMEALPGPAGRLLDILNQWVRILFHLLSDVQMTDLI